jgi:hypothetical protein
MEQTVQILRCEIRAVIPGNGVAHNSKGLKVVYISQWFEYRAIQKTTQVNFSIRAVIKPQMNSVPGNMLGLDNVKDHLPTLMDQSNSVGVRRGQAAN